MQSITEIEAKIVALKRQEAKIQRMEKYNLIADLAEIIEAYDLTPNDLGLDNSNPSLAKNNVTSNSDPYQDTIYCEDEYGNTFELSQRLRKWTHTILNRGEELFFEYSFCGRYSRIPEVKI